MGWFGVQSTVSGITGVGVSRRLGVGDVGVLDAKEIEEIDSFLPHLSSRHLDLVGWEYSQRFELRCLGVKLRLGVAHSMCFWICSSREYCCRVEHQQIVESPISPCSTGDRGASLTGGYNEL